MSSMKRLFGAVVDFKSPRCFDSNHLAQIGEGNNFITKTERYYLARIPFNVAGQVWRPSGCVALVRKPNVWRLAVQDDLQATKTFW